MKRPHWRWLTMAATLVVLAGALVLLRLQQPATADAAVLRDFHTDQQAAIRAEATGDSSTLRGRWTGNALQNLENDIQGGNRVQQTIDEQSAQVVAAPDPNDPSVGLEVHQVAILREDSISSDGTQQPIGTWRVDGRYWLRPLDGRYAITDQQRSVQPYTAGPPGALWLLLAGVAILLLAGLAVLLRRRSARTDGQAESAESIPRATPAEEPDWAPEPAAALRMRLCGGLEILHDGEDLAPALRERPTASFVWLLVLLYGLLGRDLGRTELADEVYPGLDPETRRRRLRNLLSNFRGELPEPLVQPLLIDRSSARFDLVGCALDVREVSRLADRLGGAVAPSALVAAAEELLTSTTGEVLPFWEALVEQVTEGRGGATELVTELREQVTRARIAIQLSVADSYLQHGAPDKAIDLLSEALASHPDRVDVAQRLARALRLSGGEREAAEVLGGYS